MEVEFLVPWQGSKVGDIGEFVPFITDDLLKRKIVKPASTSEQDTIKKQAAEITKLKKQLKAAKQIAAAPIDKQVKSAANK